MYDETYRGVPRIDDAKAALGEFVAQVSGSRDTMGVLSFNTALEELAPMGSDPANIQKRIQTLVRPGEDMSYTELYQGLNQSCIESPSTVTTRSSPSTRWASFMWRRNNFV